MTSSSPPIASTYLRSVDSSMSARFSGAAPTRKAQDLAGDSANRLATSMPLTLA
jgi:hypothetical protein